MNVIVAIISTLSIEDRKAFVNLLSKKNKRKDTKNIQLFKLLESQPNAKDIDVQLYGKSAKGAYHALSKRLFDSLIDFVATKNFEGEQTQEMEIIKLLLASRILFEQKAFKVALKIIKKAELKAKQYELYSILNEIYYTRIQYAHLDKTIALNDLISRFKSNKLLCQQEENLNLFYATVQNQLLTKSKSVSETMSRTLAKFDLSIENGLSYRSLFKIVEINNKAATITRNFYSILPFIEKVNKEIELKKKLSEKHLFYHIQILYYIANSYFRNKEFETSVEYLDKMYSEMQKQNKTYYSRFLPQYTLVRILNYNYTGQAKNALNLINSFDFTIHKQQISYLLDLKLTTAMILFQQNEHKQAFKVIKEFNHSDNWYTQKAGEIWVVKKNMTEIIFYLESENIDLAESRIKSFRKKHGEFLTTIGETRVLNFLSLATQYFYNKQKNESNYFMKKIKNKLSAENYKNEDLFIQTFYAWLKSKVLKLDVYQTTLDYVKKDSKN
ncbi:hypothetical protein KO500_05670 [Cellulophaga baltica]|uniref:hypothetical protein n=1 Tax=Cellulophaga TaxID=104264 RepID=UPI001C0668BC|nr:MULTISPECIES: hypothetical protein [Cellulophaga]MBU2995909.1 hypothetical protein [Cellulophaga baltica]MDO6767304.1 hypothetical protein [Cellulophaga sp. 1_MG-2023]